MNYPTDEIVHTTVFVNSLSEDLLEREIAQWVHREGSIRRPIAQREDALPRNYISLLMIRKDCGLLEDVHVYIVLSPVGYLGYNYLNIYYSVRPPMLAVKYENDM